MRHKNEATSLRILGYVADPGFEEQYTGRSMTLDTCSKVLVDMRGFARTLNSVHGNFGIVEFLDFCTAIEAIVLHDQLKMVAQSPEEAALDGQIFTDSLDQLEKANVLADEFLYVPRPAPDPRLRRYGSRNFKISDEQMEAGEQMEVRPPFMQSSLEDAYLEAALLVDAERIANVSALSLRRYSAFYEPEARAREEHTVCDLSTQYANLSRNLQATRTRTRFPLAPYILAYIPPLPILALRRAQSRSKILEVALELRDEYSTLRNSLRQLREDLADSHVAPLKKLRVAKSWAKSWATLDRFDHASAISLGSTSFEYLDVDKSVDGETLDFNLSKLFSRLLTQGVTQFYKWRVRILHSSATRYLSTPDSAVYAEINRLFDYDLSKKDLQRLEDWESRLRQVAEAKAQIEGGR